MKYYLIKILDLIGQRDELKQYLGYGDFDAERGWWIFGKWVSAERWLK